MKFFLFLFVLIGFPDDENLIQKDQFSIINLSGNWNVQGTTSQGRLNYDIKLIDLNGRLQYWELSNQGYSSIPRKVIGYSKTEQSVVIKIEGDDGIGAYVSSYNLSIINENYLQGTVSTIVEGWAGLPGFSYSGEINLKRE